MDFLDGIGAHWVWITLGLLLAAFEMLVPGVYLIWLAIAAVLTGVLTGLLGLGVTAQVINFVFFSLIIVFSVRRWLIDSPIVSSDPLLNRRGARLVGETALVTQAIEHGSGRVHLGDSDWIARGPDIATGERVRVVGSQGAVLLVEPVRLLGQENGEESAGKGGEAP